MHSTRRYNKEWFLKIAHILLRLNRFEVFDIYCTIFSLPNTVVGTMVHRNSAAF